MFDNDAFWNQDRPRSSKRGKDEDEGYELPMRKPARVFKDLAEVDLDKELTDQIAEATSFRDHVLENSHMFQPNHVTDTIKTVNTLIAQAVKMREQVQTLVRMKAFEDAVIETMKEAPVEIKDAFFKALEERLK